jgi:hypothetical protein
VACRQPPRRASLEVAHFFTAVRAGSESRKPERRKARIENNDFRDKNMGGQENGGLVDLLVNYLPVQYRFVVPGTKRCRFTLSPLLPPAFRDFVPSGFRDYRISMGKRQRRRNFKTRIGALPARELQSSRAAKTRV